MDLEQLCGCLNLFIKARVDLPIGGLSFEMNGIEGIGLFKGDVDIQMKTEESYIGLAGLHCPGRGTARSIVPIAGQLLTAEAILCDPVLEEVFEKPQADGKEYTRDDIIENLVDWIDADNNRIVYNPVQGQFTEGRRGANSYYRDILSGKLSSKMRHSTASKSSD